MHTLIFILGLALILATLLDGFETILLPRRINRRFRYSRLYYRGVWRVWRRLAIIGTKGRWRETTLGIFGPLSLLGLFGSWILSLILGFAMMQWALNTPLLDGNHAQVPRSFATTLYFSGTTYFTLGFGDVIPSTGLPRGLTVLEVGLGFGFLAIIISYLPVLYQAFSKREVTISLLDARAGSPPTGAEFLLRLARDGRIDRADATLREWEQWSAELLESHISFPVLAYYRSQHANQSWLAALATMLDACSLLLTLLPPGESHQAQLTFAVARHAAVDIALIFGIPPGPSTLHRLSDSAQKRMEELQRLFSKAEHAGQMQARQDELRGLYEPFLEGLARHFLLTLPPVVFADPTADNWQRSAWMPKTPGIGALPPASATGSHFD